MNTSTIYTPQGKAREYSPLALNLYSGCSHGCSYCYVPIMKTKFNKDYDHSYEYQRKNIIGQLEKDAQKFFNTDQQVLMSFTTDPYTELNEKLQLTKQSLEILLFNKIPVSILSKSGLLVYKDFEIIKQFGEHIKVGASLTFDNAEDSYKVEPGAASPSERLFALKIFHSKGIKTWASMEPVIKAEQTLNLIEMSLPYVDEYRIGKLNYHASKNDWNDFLQKTVDILRATGKQFYIKQELRNEAPGIKLYSEEINMDLFNLKPF